MTTASWYGRGLGHLDDDVDWAADTIKTALVSGYTFDQDAHEFFSDVSGSEVSGTGYTAGGQTLANAAVSYDATNSRRVYDADDVVWDASGGELSADGAVVYHDTGTASSSPLLGYVDFEQTVTATNDTFTISWSADGVLYIEAS